MNYPVTTESMLFFLARRTGLDPLVNLSPDQACEFLTALDDRLREGWEFYDFLETTLTEERAFRADYDPAFCYEQGDYVWDPCSRSYYQALGTGIGGPLSNSAIWQAFPTVAPAYILWFQFGKTPIGSCFKAYTLNPFEDVNAVEVPFVVSPRGVEFLPNQVPATVWIQFRIPYPGLGLFAWDATITYNSGEPVIYGSDTYHSLVDGNLGNDPSIFSEQWRVFRIPYVLSRFTQMAAYADSLVTNGQNEKATAEEGKAYSYLNQEYDKQTIQQGQQQRFSVYTR